MIVKKDIVTILSIDGGGIRGIIPIVILQALREIIRQKKVDQPLYKLFDLMAGSSTGGLISLALASPNPVTDEPMTLKEILSFYQNNSSHIFESSKPTIIKAVTGLFKPPINPDNFEEQLFKIFGNETLKDVLVDIYITSLTIPIFQPLNFKRILPSQQNYSNYYLRDIARATAAEPPLFPPAKIKCLNKPIRYCLIDGCFYASNPSLNAYFYAKRRFPNASKYVILSLGTGTASLETNCHAVENWGLLEWISPRKNIPAVQAFLKGQMNNVTDLLDNLEDVELIRLDPSITQEQDSSSDISAENIDSLEEVAKEFTLQHQRDLTRVANYLIESIDHNINQKTYYI